MKLNQKGVAELVVIITLLVLGVGGFFVYQNISNSNKTKDSSAKTEFSQFTSFDDCVAYYSKPGEDPSVANDTCITLQQSAEMSSTTQPEVKSTIPPSITPETKQVSCSPEAPLDNATGAFKELPFDVSNIKLVTLGKETNDPRFVYPWVKSGKANIYAPADGVLYMIRHKVFEVNGEKGNDYDMFFKVDCGTVYRFNHISDPRQDIKDAYPAGDLPSGDYANGGVDIPERVQPKTNIRVKAGELLGSTSGVPWAHDFDFAVGIAKEAPKDGEHLSVCPFSVFNEPHKSTLMNLLGPKSGSPQPGYQCDVPSSKF